MFSRAKAHLMQADREIAQIQFEAVQLRKTLNIQRIYEFCRRAYPCTPLPTQRYFATSPPPAGRAPAPAV
jgi:hypothetical protein